MISDFKYKTLPHTVHFGAGKRSVLIDLLKDKKTFVIASKRLSSIVDELGSELNSDALKRFEKVIQHVPRTLVDEALSQFKSDSFDYILAIGGGSAIGLAKAIALETGTEIIAMPTTYSGSEMTNIWGISDDGGKTTGRNDIVMPKVIIYEMELTKGMPKTLALPSAINALAHLIEAMYAVDGNPITFNNAMMGIASIQSGLHELSHYGEVNDSVNRQLSFGGYMGGKVLGEVSMALHHKAAHVLGGSFGMEHSQVHTVLLPYVLNYQWSALSSDLQSAIKKATHSDNPARQIHLTVKELGGPTTLKEIGFEESNIPKAVEIMTQAAYPNPRPLVKADLEQMLSNAFHGKV